MVPSDESGDGGAIAAFVVLIMVGLLGLLGLVVDGGTALTAHQTAQVEAEQAARAGAGALSIDALRDGEILIDGPAAIAAAERFMAEAGHPGSVAVAGGVVTVRVQLPGSDGHPRPDRDQLDRRIGGGCCGGCRRRDPGRPVNRAINAGRTGRPRTRGLVAGLVLIVLVVGVPAALTLVAGGPSAHLDPGALWRAAVHHRPGDVHVVTAWLARAALLVAWIAWAWLTICVAAEVRAWMSGRTTVRLPASRSMQWIAAVLVGTAFAVGTAGRVPAHSVVPVGAHGNPPATVGLADSGSEPTPTRPSSEGTPPDGNIAPGSRVFTDAPPLADVSPQGSHAAVVAGTYADAAGWSARHLVSCRETLWSIAEDRLGDARRWRDIADLNYSVDQPDGSRLTSDHWILPGWELLLPGGDGAGTTGPVHDSTPATAPSSTPAPAPDSTPAAGHPTAEALLSRTPHQQMPVIPLGAGIVGIGVSDLVDRLRRVQQRHRKSGGRIRLPEPLLRAFEQRLRVGEGRSDLDIVEAAVGACVALLAPQPTPSRLQWVSVTATHVRLTFDTPPELLERGRFTTNGSPLTLEIEQTALDPIEKRVRGARRAFWTPTLVTVGRTQDELVMVNLEGVGSLVLGGPVNANMSVGRAMALELATSRWSTAYDLILIGFGADMERCGQVIVTADAGPTLADLSWRRLTTGMRLDEEDHARVDRARRLGDPTAWRPMVVVCGAGIESADIEAMVALAEDGRSGIAVVVIGDPGTPSLDGSLVIRTDVDHPTGATDVLGARMVPQRLTEQELNQVVAIVDVARGHDDPVDPGSLGDPRHQADRDDRVITEEENHPKSPTSMRHELLQSAPMP